MRHPILPLVLVFATSCGSTAPTTTTVPAGVYPDLAHGGSCHLSDGSVAAEGVTAESDDDCNDCTCRSGGWECTERDCG